MIELLAVIMLVMIVVGSAVGGTLIALIGSIIFAVIVNMVWSIQSLSVLRQDATAAEDQLQIDIDLLEACRKDRGVSAKLKSELMEEFGHMPDIREIGHAIRQRHRNLEVLRGLYITQSAALRVSGTFLGYATFLVPSIAIALCGIYTLTRLRPCRRLLRTAIA